MTEPLFLGIVFGAKILVVTDLVLYPDEAYKIFDIGDYVLVWLFARRTSDKQSREQSKQSSCLLLYHFQVLVV